MYILRIISISLIVLITTSKNGFSETVPQSSPTLAKRVVEEVQRYAQQHPFTYTLSVAGGEEDGEVVLSGKVEDQKTEELLLYLAQKTSGVKKVTNRLTITQDGTDAQLLTRIREAIDFSPLCTGPSTFQMIVEQGVVVLTGQLPWHKEGDCVSQVISKVPGVRKVTYKDERTTK